MGKGSLPICPGSVYRSHYSSALCAVFHEIAYVNKELLATEKLMFLAHYASHDLGCADPLFGKFRQVLECSDWLVSLSSRLTLHLYNNLR